MVSSNATGSNTSTTLAALFKEVYGENLMDAIPEGAMLVKELKFAGVESTQGGKFVLPVILTRENGFTYQAGDSDAFDLRTPGAATVKRAELTPSQLVGTGRMGYEAAARAAKGKAAFAEATDLLIENLMESASYRLELEFLSGQTGLGAVDAATVSSTSFVISAATWAPSVWAGVEGSYLTIYSSTLATRRTAADTGTAVSAVDMEEDSATYRTVTVGDAQTLTAGDLVFFASAVTGTGNGTPQECLGLEAILAVSTGNLFAISTAYPLWRGNTYDVGSEALTVTHLLKATKRAVNKGLKESVKALISPKAWYDMVNPLVDPKDSSRARGIDSSYSAKKLEVGTESISIHGPSGRNIEVKTHPYMKEGKALILPFKYLRRCGAQDISFKTPGMSEEQMFLQLSGAAGYEFRCYANQAIFIDAPSKGVLVTGIA